MSKKNSISDQQLLFDAEEMGRITPGDLWEERDEPVTCLGQKFPNEEARREFFREELRKKLPELRKIEGFPIGTDDDIINLSDPPYYTACPNPWLNDFITQWEGEKKQLEADGKRKADFEVKEPYASDVSEGKNNPIYMAHAYHTKVPHPAIMRYILHYTQPGDIIFDGFAGTGMTGVAANLCGSKMDVDSLKETSVTVGVRHGICSDLSPIATLISANYNLPFNNKLFEIKARKILDQVQSELGWMYETEVLGSKASINYVIWSDVYSCPNCGSELTLWEHTVNLDDKIIRNEFYCPHCGSLCTKKNMTKVHETIYDSTLGHIISIAKKLPVRVNYIQNKKRGELNVSEYDMHLLQRIEGIDTSNLRTSEIPKGDEVSRNEKDGISHIHHFYTKRCFIYLSRVNELVKGDVFLQAWFTSVLLNVSKMYKFRIDRKGSMLYGTFYIPSYNIEFNPYRTLLSKIRDFSLTQYKERSNSCISLNSAIALNTVKSNSIDYIFTDPPFGSNLMYSELSSIWEGWINVKTNNETEAVISSVQNKGISDYNKLLYLSLKEYYRILKPGKWITVEFSNTSASVWNSIQSALQSAGFVVANVAALDKKQGSFKTVTTTTAVKQDLVITCYKPSKKIEGIVEKNGNGKEYVWDFVEYHLGKLSPHVEKDNKTTTVIERSPKILYDRLVSYFVRHGQPVPMDASEFQSGLKDRFIERDGMFFIASQVGEYEEKRKHTDGFAPMGIIVSDEANGIEWLKNQLRESPKTYQQIQPEWMQAINGLRKGDILPELKTLLEENFIEMEDGKWRLPNIQDDVDKNLLRTKALLREFNLYKEQALKPKAKLREVRVEALRAGFKQCYFDKDFQTIVTVGDKIPQNLRDEDEVLLQFYDIALNKL